MAYVTQKFHYLGIDETSLGLNNNSFIIVVAETHDPSKKEYQGYNVLKKAKDFLREAQAYVSGDVIQYDKIPRFPSYHEMKMNGLKDFLWMRANNGRFSRQLVEHAGLAHIVAKSNYSPERTVLFIDAFHGNYEMSKYLIKKSLHHKNFKISDANIVICGGGDRSIPIINYADLLAFQIGLYFNETYNKYFSNQLEFPIVPNQINWDENRVIEGLTEDDRSNLEKDVKRWSAHK